MIKSIFLNTPTLKGGPFVTSADAYEIVERAKTVYSIDQEKGLYNDGRLHIGTECSRIYKQLFPSGIVKQNELCYIELSPKVRAIFDKNEVKYNSKKLKTKLNRDIYYCQLISLDLLGIYLGGVFDLSDAQVYKILGWANTKKLTLNIPNKYIVSGNKPVNIEGKPLVKILNEKSVDTKEIESHSIQSSKAIGIELPASSTLEYVKTGPLMRKDIYVALKAISAKEGKFFYETLEDILLGRSEYTLGMLLGGEI